ncbi:hypothetical protein CYMTET_5841 [Cymbomonas tetramitiformis]|uniref:SnoaL-like domain-containing protein n=1 Tax=Cymbomonas tetramitiformis TaxID=36881 RepID=A0AAE0GYA1_9CHLO|nr:hypothetical protein CYMTET_5841 [Cymbomonas tetramitiformis]
MNSEDRIAQLERMLDELQSKEQIRDVMHRYARSVDRCDIEGLKACYWEDGWDDHGFFGGNAHEFADYVIPILEQAESSIHQISNEIIELDGDRAFTECYWQVLHRLPKGDEFLDYMHEGRYLDVFERRHGTWKIYTRTIVGDSDRLFQVADLKALMVEGAKAIGMTGEIYEPHAIGRRAPADLVFKKEEFVNFINKNRDAVEDFWAPFIAMAPILQSRWKQHILRLTNRLRRKR